MENEEVSLRESLEQAATELENTSDAPPIEDAPPTVSDDTENPSLQQTDGVATSDVTEPVGDDPSDEGSVTPTGSDVKSIEDVVETAPTEKPVVEPDAVNVTQKKLDTAPASWKGDAKQLWADLPEKAREEVVRREIQTQQVLNETAIDRKRVQEMSQVLSPHMDRISSLYGGNPMQAVDSLLNVERVLTSGNQATKAQIVAKIINDFGVDINALDSMLAGNELPPEMKQQSDVERLVEERLAPMNQFLEQQKQHQQQIRQQRSSQINTTIQEMAYDTANYPYFNEVREDMADVIDLSIKRGVDISLEEAYNKAVIMNGRTAKAVDTRQTTQTETQAALDAHQKAQKAKGASVSVSGNPTSVGTPPPKSDDLRSLISDALDNGGGRV